MIDSTRTVLSKASMFASSVLHVQVDWIGHTRRSCCLLRLRVSFTPFFLGTLGYGKLYELHNLRGLPHPSIERIEYLSVLVAYQGLLKVTKYFP